MKRWPLLFFCIFSAYFVSYLSVSAVKNKRDAAAPGAIERIVSLNAAATRILVGLGLEDRIVGVNDTLSNPPEVGEKPKVGRGFGNISVETVVALRPDIVFAYNSDAEILEEKDIAVFVVDTCTFDDVMRLVSGIGKAVDKGPEARRITERMRREIEGIREQLKKAGPPPLVYFEAGAAGRTRAPGSLTHDLITMAGGTNLAKDEPVPFPVLNTEYIIEMDPDVIILEEYGTRPREVKKRDGWQGIKAVRNGRIFVSPAVYTNYTPDCIEGLKEYARWFHPEAFER